MPQQAKLLFWVSRNDHMQRTLKQTFAKALALARTSMMPMLAGEWTASCGNSSPPSGVDSLCMRDCYMPSSVRRND